MLNATYTVWYAHIKVIMNGDKFTRSIIISANNLKEAESKIKEYFYHYDDYIIMSLVSDKNKLLLI